MRVRAVAAVVLLTVLEVEVGLVAVAAAAEGFDTDVAREVEDTARDEEAEVVTELDRCDDEAGVVLVERVDGVVAGAGAAALVAEAVRAMTVPDVVREEVADDVAADLLELDAVAVVLDAALRVFGATLVATSTLPAGRALLLLLTAAGMAATLAGMIALGAPLCKARDGRGLEPCFLAGGGVWQDDGM